MFNDQTITINRASKPTRAKLGFKYRLSRSFLLTLVLGLLFALDFVIYLRSGSVVLADGGFKMPILLNLGYIFIAAAALMFVTLFFLPLQNLIFSFMCGVLAWGMMSQFLQIDKDHYLTILLSPLLGEETTMMIDGYSAWILAGLIAIISYLMVRKISLNTLVSFVIAFFLLLLCFLGVDLLTNHNNKQYSQIYTSTETTFASTDQKTIFLFLPYAPSYPVISAESRNKVDKRELLQQVELGFLIKNGFTVYPNAYVTGESDEQNLVEFLNVLDNTPYEDHVLSPESLENFWKFKSSQKPSVLIKDNQLLDIFSKAKYKVSAYQNPKFELCKKNGQYSVDRCVSRRSLPLEINSISFSENEQAGVLLNQWLHSFDLFDNQQIIDALSLVLSREDVKNLMMPYQYLYSVNSFDVLQNLLDDISQDKGAGVYFVYLNLPDNMLVYNEWCRLKSPDRWNVLNSDTNMVMSQGNSTSYNEQMLCLWGKMGDFIQNLVSLGQADNITLVLHGVSGIEPASVNRSFTDKFKNQNLVFMAIRDPKAQFSVDSQICRSKDILTHYLFQAKTCKEFKGVALAQGAEEVLRNELKKSGIKKKMFDSAVEGYEKWLEEWNINRQPPFLKVNLSSEKEEQVNVRGLKIEAAAQLLSDGKGMQSVNIQESILTDDEDDVEEISQPLEESEPVIESEGNDVVPLEHISEDVTEEKVQEEVVSEENEEQTLPQEIQEEEISETTDNKEEDHPKELVIEDDFIPTADDEEMVSDAELSKVAPKKEVSQPVAKPAPKKVETFTVTTQPVITVKEVSPVAQPIVINSVPLSEEAAPALNAAILQIPVDTSTTTVVESQSGEVHYLETSGQPVPVSGDFLINEEQDEWQLDPAKAMGVSGDEATERQIIIQEQ